MMERPVSRVLQALASVNGRPPAKTAKGWTAPCPAHEDRKPSLSISEGDDGRALVFCHGGCAPESIVAALGLALRDLMPDNGDGHGIPRRAQAPSRPRPTKARPADGDGHAAKLYPTAGEAVAELERRHGKRSALWTYTDGEGEPIGVILRWDCPDGSKDIRPVSRAGSGWVIGGMPEPRPLYQLPELRDRDAEPVYVCEGEKAADAARAVGLLATTSPHGAKSAGKADWMVLAARDVVLIPDNDPAGQAYVRDVAELLAKLTPAPRVRIVELPGLPPGGDFVEYLAARRSAGLDDTAIRAEVIALADAAAIVEAEPPPVAPGPAPVSAKPPPALRPIPPYAPFPLAVLPDVLARFVCEAAAALGCDPAYVALPVLATAAAAIGTTRTIELKASWAEPSIVWVGVVARSGTLKSPAFDAAVAPLRQAQIEALRDYDEAREAHNRAALEYDRDLAAWRKSKGGDAPPEKPQAPTAKRFVIGDCTAESLAPLLEGNPRGLLVARDELAGWVRSFNQYKSGQGADAAAWLELWRAGTLIVDRKAGDRRTVYVPQAAVSVCGTIQPGVLADVLTAEHFESGLAARLLLARPPELVKRWSDRAPSRAAVDGYERLIRSLLTLEHADGEHGPEPVKLPLTPDAREAWRGWYDRHARRIHEAETDREAAALAKCEAYGARFALIFELAGDPGARAVSADALTRGIALADWFATEAERVYAIIGEDDDARELRRLSEWIQKHGGGVTLRDLTRGPRQYRDNAAAQAALDGLVKAGLGRWVHPVPGPAGGRPAPRFELGDGDKTPDGDSANRGFVTVATVATAQREGGDAPGEAEEPLPGLALDDCPEALGLAPGDDPGGDEVAEWTA